MTGQRGSIRDWLAPGERIIWEGGPDPKAYALRGAWYLIPFSLLWGGFAIFWEVTAIASGAPVFFDLWGIPFVVIGLYMIFGRLYVAFREARRTTYALTDRRILIISGAFRRSFTALELRTMPGASLEERDNGVGSITFGISSGFRMPPGWPTMGARYSTVPTFSSIPEARRIFGLYERARAEAA